MTPVSNAAPDAAPHAAPLASPHNQARAFLIGGGIGSLAAAAFMVRDGHWQGQQITIFEALPTLGGSLDGSGNPDSGYSLGGGRMLTTANYECTWDLFKSIPSLQHPEQTVFEETDLFNQQNRPDSMARLVDKYRSKIPVKSMGFSMHDRIELLKLSRADEPTLGASRITDWLSPDFFQSEFWFMWATTFAFQPWHSAVEFKRYLHRFMLEFTRIETLAGVKRTVVNQYESLVLPLQAWLEARGVIFRRACTVTALEHNTSNGKFTVTAIQCQPQGQAETISVRSSDFAFLQNGSMTDASSLGSMTSAPPKLGKQDCTSWQLWETLANERSDFGHPEVFNSCIAQSCWASFTATLKDTAFFDAMQQFSGNVAGTGGLVTFRDSNWLMSVVLAHQPHFVNQPAGVQVFWGYALFPDRIGNFVPKAMADCSGAEILTELCGHLRFDAQTVATANCIPCRMPYITSMFMPRSAGDRPLPVPVQSENLAFISQFVEIPGDVVFTVEYSVRAAQMAVYKLLGIKREVPPIKAHDDSVKTQFDALLKAFT